MIVYTTDPAAKVSALRDSLNHIVDILRRLGAEADVTESVGRKSLHVIVLTLAVPCSTDKALSISFMFQNFARESGGELHETPFSADMSGVHEAEYRAALAYAVTKPPRPRKRARAAT